MQPIRNGSLLRELLAAVLKSNISAADLKILSRELRSGRLADELAYLIDEVAGHFAESPSKDDLSAEVAKVEQILKDKKIPKGELSNVIRSLGIVPDSVLRNNSTRAILKTFFDIAAPSQARQLQDILLASGRADDYLKGISERRG